MFYHLIVSMDRIDLLIDTVLRSLYSCDICNFIDVSNSVELGFWYMAFLMAWLMLLCHTHDGNAKVCDVNQ